jgi:hypothetical protein
MEIGGGIAGANKNAISSAQANDVEDMQKKLDQLKHL